MDKIKCPNCGNYEVNSRGLSDMILFGVGFIILGGLIASAWFGAVGLVYSTFIGLIIIVLSPVYSLGIKHKYKCNNCKYEFDKEDIKEEAR